MWRVFWPVGHGDLGEAAGVGMAIARPAPVELAAVPVDALPWLGFVPDEVSSAPPVARLAERLGLDPGVPEWYGRRSHTRSRARRTVLQRRSLGRARPRRPLPGRRRTPAPARTTAGSVPARPPGITPPFSVSTQRRTLSMCGRHGGRLAPRCGAERRECARPSRRPPVTRCNAGRPRLRTPGADSVPGWWARLWSSS